MLKATGIEKRFFRKTGEANFFYAVRPVDISLEKGTVTMLTGRSGSGKTTLLEMLAGLVRPSAGKVTLDDTDLYAEEDASLSVLRAARFAVIPQGNAAVGSLTVTENILLPVVLSGGDRKKAEEKAKTLMERLQIAHLADAMPDGLSGGEKRRMSIARALCGTADVIFADEPTGDLDDENTRTVLTLLKEAAQDGAAVLLVTHEREAEAWADRVLYMNAGVLEEKTAE